MPAVSFILQLKHVNNNVRVAYMQIVLRPDRQYEFPQHFFMGVNISLSYRWLNENPFPCRIRLAVCFICEGYVQQTIVIRTT